MVQLFLAVGLGGGRWPRACPTALLLLLPFPGFAQLEMDGGRRLVFERSFNSEREVRGKRGFWTKVKDAVAGEPAYHGMVRPYGVATDSRGRVVVTDPGAYGVHLFDFGQQKYRFLSHREGENAMLAPQCVAVDERDNIYVTDAEAGAVFVFGANGKFQRVIGGLRSGEGIFKRPTGIAVDAGSQRIYVTDTWRNQIFVLDMQGGVRQIIGKAGHGDGEFNFPTELRLAGPDLMVVDAMNFRIQVLDRTGTFRFTIGSGGLFRPKGLDVDSEGHVYVADAFQQVVYVFDRAGQVLYYFGRPAGIGDFELPASLAIDGSDRIFVVDGSHQRVQVFHYLPGRAGGAGE